MVACCSVFSPCTRLMQNYGCSVPGSCALVLAPSWAACVAAHCLTTLMNCLDQQGVVDFLGVAPRRRLTSEGIDNHPFEAMIQSLKVSSKTLHKLITFAQSSIAWCITSPKKIAPHPTSSAILYRYGSSDRSFCLGIDLTVSMCS